jgi:hypothetical protein
LALAVASAAVAITNGVRDGNAHPNVGAFLVKKDGSWRVLCTGSLVAPKVFLTLHQKDNRDEGGTGYGDSGGPTLPNGTAIAVVSTGDVPCWSTSVNTGIDTQDAADFLRPYLALK